jgi:hypothetical protein
VTECGIYAEAIERSAGNLHARFRPTISRVVPLLAVAVSACNPFASEAAEPEVCREQQREVLVNEQLAPETPSTSFVVTGDDEIWVGLIADSDVTPGALFSQVTGLYAIAEGDPVEYTRGTTDFIVVDDPYLGYDSEGQFRRFELPPGTYQLWSVKAPEVAVVSCGPLSAEG